MQIEAKNLKQGDVFVFNNKENVAIEEFCGNSLWVTNQERYIKKENLNNFSYGYTSATIISIDENDKVELIKNLEDN